MATERLIVAVLAIAAGAAMGYWPGLQVIELVDLTPQGGAPVPPFIPAIQGWLMAAVLSGLLAASTLSVGFAAVAADDGHDPVRLHDGCVIRSDFTSDYESTVGEMASILVSESQARQVF